MPVIAELLRPAWAEWSSPGPSPATHAVIMRYCSGHVRTIRLCSQKGSHPLLPTYQHVCHCAITRPVAHVRQEADNQLPASRPIFVGRAARSAVQVDA